MSKGRERFIPTALSLGKYGPERELPLMSLLQGQTKVVSIIMLGSRAVAMTPPSTRASHFLPALPLYPIISVSRMVSGSKLPLTDGSRPTLRSSTPRCTVPADVSLGNISPPNARSAYLPASKEHVLLFKRASKQGPCVLQQGLPCKCASSVRVDRLTHGRHSGNNAQGINVLQVLKAHCNTKQGEQPSQACKQSKEPSAKQIDVVGVNVAANVHQVELVN